MVEHRFAVPLHPGSDRTIELFAREVRAPAAADDDRPYLLMLNGGPGQPAARPDVLDGWLPRALRGFHVVLLDQRGTGLSSPVTARSLAAVAPGDAAAQAEHLAHFRADAIVRDAEAIRPAFTGGAPWSILGQSFGGFCALTYLSFAPEGVREAFITGGLPPLTRPADDVYRGTFSRLDTRLAAYFTRYPDDRAAWERVLAALEAEPVAMPRGGTLSARRLRTIGLGIGMEPGFERLHYLIEQAWDGEALSATFLEAVEQQLSFTRYPLYAVLHEAVYAQGEATRWAAQRILDAHHAPPLLLGEMIFPWMFEDEPSLRPFAEVAELLAQRAEWPRLYDPAQLAANEVPAVAAVYLDDMYVDADLSRETASAVGGLRVWLTNEAQHDGLHRGPVLDRLLAMRRGER